MADEVAEEALWGEELQLQLQLSCSVTAAAGTVSYIGEEEHRSGSQPGAVAALAAPAQAVAAAAPAVAAAPVEEHTETVLREIDRESTTRSKQGSWSWD